MGGFFHYNLGSEYFAVGDVDKAVDEFETAVGKVDEDDTYRHEYVPSLRAADRSSACAPLVATRRRWSVPSMV